MLTQYINPNKNKILFGSLICAVAGLFYCYEFILRIIPGALQTELSIAFGNISATTFGGLAAFYYFAYSPMQLPVGMLMDRYGPKKLLTLACMCCTVGTWLFMDTSSLLIASGGRFLVGFGSSFAFVGVLTLTIYWLPRQYFSLVVGLITTFGMLGIIYGEVKITDIAVSMGWEQVFYLIIIAGIILTILIFILVSDGEKGLIVNRHPLPNFFLKVGKVLFSSKIWLIGLIGACLYTSLSVFGELWGKTYLENAHHLTKLEAAKTISALFLGWAIGAPIVGYLSDSTGKRIILLLIGAMASLFCISIVLYYPNLCYTWLNIFLFLYGICSSSEIIIFIMAKEITGAELSGTVFAVVNMIVTLGGVILQPLVGKLLDIYSIHGTDSNVHIYSVTSYKIALSILPISLLIVIIILFFMKDAFLKNIVVQKQ